MKSILKLISSLIIALVSAVAAFADGATSTTTPTGGMDFTMIIMLVLLGVVFYFFMYRPQKKQEKEIKQMRDNLTVGDEVVTTAGILGRVVRIKEDVVTLELGSDRTKMKVFNWAIREVILPANASDDEAPKKVEAEK